MLLQTRVVCPELDIPEGCYWFEWIFVLLQTSVVCPELNIYLRTIIFPAHICYIVRCHSSWVLGRPPAMSTLCCIGSLEVCLVNGNVRVDPWMSGSRSTSLLTTCSGSDLWLSSKETEFPPPFHMPPVYQTLPREDCTMRCAASSYLSLGSLGSLLAGRLCSLPRNQTSAAFRRVTCI